ncbi:MAG: CHRD domain-containing protein [Euryarchaeota archaeon]|nr:CHRD domain-containing protein [Euryarchaeota archaeon]
MSNSDSNRQKMPRQATDFSTTVGYLPVNDEDGTDTARTTDVSTNSRTVNRRQVLSATGAAIVGGFVMSGSAAADEHPSSFSTDLSGDAEVPPVETNASGWASFELSEDGSEVHFEVYIDCIRNVNQGHIHLGGEDENGPVVVWLYPQETQEPETIEGLQREFTLAEGTLTEEDLVGPFEGESLDALAEAMEAGETYVNIHSEQNPDGEIRGQIEVDEAPEEPVEAAVEEEEEEEEVDEEPEEEVDEDSEEEEPVEDGEISVSSTNVATGRDVSQESVTFQNTGDGDLDLSGWSVTDREDGGTGSVYTFSDFTLEAGAEVELITGDGSDSDDTVHWGLGAPRWNQDGDTIVVTDASGSEVLAHEYGGGAPSIQMFFNQVRALFA